MHIILLYKQINFYSFWKSIYFELIFSEESENKDMAFCFLIPHI